MNLIRLLLGLKEPYQVMFFEREFKSLSGVGNRLIISLIGILIITFTAICFAVGAVENLEVKMNDPFTNWIDIPIKSGEGITRKNLSTFISEFDTDSVKSNYAIKNISKSGTISLEFYKNTFSPFHHRQDTLIRTRMGQTIDFESALYRSIVEEINVLQDFTPGDSLNPTAQQIIVNAELLRTIGYEDGLLPGPLLFVQTQDEELIPLYVAGIVKRLPKNIGFVCSESLKNVFDNMKPDLCGDKYIKSNLRTGNRFEILLMKDHLDMKMLTTELAKKLQTEDPITYELKDTLIINSVTYQAAFLQFGYSDEIDYFDLKRLLDNNDSDKPFILVAKFEPRIDCKGLDRNQVEYLQFNFFKLDSIEPFAYEMQKTYDVNLNMREVKSKENFSLVSDLTLAISVILFAFGLLSIILYVNNQLRTHLNSIKSNLGTFKAFGLSNAFLVSLYRKIVFSYLIGTVFVALIAVFAIDLIEYQLVEEGESKFQTISPWLFLAIGCLFIISDFVSRGTIKRILEKTPGDLIYNR